jgi:hypothetical protein
MSTAIPDDWIADFEAASARSLEERMRYAFIHTYKPVLDDAPFRAFDTMADYRAWCEANLPSWLGYGKACCWHSRIELDSGDSRKQESSLASHPITSEAVRCSSTGMPGSRTMTGTGETNAFARKCR